MPAEQRFAGRIAGFGSDSGIRVVIGRWDRTPLGSFADVMVEDPTGHRVLLAPNRAVADLLEQTYSFDEVVLGPVDVSSVADVEATDRRSIESRWRLSGPGLEVDLQLGARTPVGWVLRALPKPLATSPSWLTVVNPAAALIMNGVRTRGTAGNGRTEFYGAYDVRAVTAVEGRWRGTDLGDLARVEPPVHFGFGSTPAAPAVTSLVTTIRFPTGELTAD